MNEASDPELKFDEIEERHTLVAITTIGEPLGPLERSDGEVTQGRQSNCDGREQCSDRAREISLSTIARLHEPHVHGGRGMYNKAIPRTVRGACSR